MNTGPMAFMRGLTFPGGQQPVLRGDGVYLRYPRIVDYHAWARLRGESRDFLAPWEPVWASDELTKGAFRRRIKRYQKETRLRFGLCVFCLSCQRRCPDGRLHVVQCPPRRYAMLRAGLLDRRALRAPGLYVRCGEGAGSVHLRDAWSASNRGGLSVIERTIQSLLAKWGFAKEGVAFGKIFRLTASGRIISYSLCSPTRRG